jgi:uncharacterized membrane-anchored protein YhcB (DUF1043 family)
MLVALVAFPLLALAVGVLVGRRTSEAAHRARTLEAELDAERAALERVLGEKRAVEEDLAKEQAQAAGYRESVVQHFYGTSEQLRALTLRYRELFVHLADGARELCPEASSALQAGLEPPALAPLAGESEAPAPATAAVAPEPAAPADAQPGDAPVRVETF